MGQRLVAPTDRGATLEIDMPRSRESFGGARVELVKAEPRVRLKKWSDELSLEVRHSAISATAIVENSQVKWIQADREMHAYPLEAELGMEDGGFEIELLLKTPPSSNVFNFQLTGWENLDFFFQTPLTAPERAAGHSRPANVDGSYAVYHKTRKHYRLGGINYATGKAFHIYRPRVTDALNARTWGDLSYSAGVLTVTVPQAFLNTATYPVVVDPTFGYTTIGASQYNSSHSDFTEGTLAEAGTLVSISFYTAAAFGGTLNVKGALYTDVADIVTTLVAVGSPVSVGATDAWFDSPASGALSAGDFYVGKVDDAAGGEFARFWYDGGAGTSRYVCDTNYASPGNSPTCTGGFSGKFSMYATYVLPAPPAYIGYSAFPKHKIAQRARGVS